MKPKLLTLIILLLQPLLSGNAQAYMEIPAFTDNGGPYITHSANLGNGPMRSFTYRYDTNRHIALWVAYPLNSGLIGEGSRGDGWTPDPLLDKSAQAILYKGFKYGSGYDRGHQIPSADRLRPEANAQTFIFTNATPQLHDFNGGIWAELEKTVRTWARRSDTLYVVTGCIPGEKTIQDNVGQDVNIPSKYYKAVLRLSHDKLGRKHWSMCAVVLPHENISKGTWKENMEIFREHSMCIKKLEQLTGETFYPLLKDIIGTKEYNELKWSLPSVQTWWWK